MVASVVSLLPGTPAKPETRCAGIAFGVENGGPEPAGRLDLSGTGGQGQPVTTGVADVLLRWMARGACWWVPAQPGCRHDPSIGAPDVAAPTWRWTAHDGPVKLLQDGHLAAQALRALTASVSAGATVKRSPTTPKVAISKIGASLSLLIAMIVFEVCMPARCWIAPEMPNAM